MSNQNEQEQHTTYNVLRDPGEMIQSNSSYKHNNKVQE